MTTSKTSYKELSIPYFNEVFEIIDKVMSSNDIPYYLIGVNAIALELLKDNIKPTRGTKDIDFAIMVSSLSQYDKIVDDLSEHGFNRVKVPWTLYQEKLNIVIDLLPFGEIEEHHTVSFNERVTDLHVLGFREILENPKQISVEEIIVNIPPIPGMVILKLVAWSDRPEERDNDLSDILKIIQSYYDFNLDNILSMHHDLLIDPFDRLKISARVLGREASHYLIKSNALESRIFKVLDDNLKDAQRSKIAIDWAKALHQEVQYALEILKEFESGLRESK